MHPRMLHPQVYYINIKPYIYRIPFPQLINKLVHSQILNINNIPAFIQYVKNTYAQFNYRAIQNSKEENHKNIIVGNQLLSKLKIYLN